MSWRGDRYKLADKGEEQAANQGACQEMGRLYDVLSVVVAEIPEREKRLVAAASLKLGAAPLAPVSSLVTKGDCVQAALVGGSADIPTRRHSDLRGYLPP